MNSPKDTDLEYPVNDGDRLVSSGDFYLEIDKITSAVLPEMLCEVTEYLP